MKAILKPKEVEYLEWKDNLSEMKRFCGSECVIEFLSCPIEDYWSLRVYDSIQNKEVTVALNDYVVKFSESEFTVVSRSDFDEYFEKKDEKKEEEQ